MTDNEHYYVTAKVMVAWLLAWIGHINVSDLAYSATFIFSSLQAYFLVRDKWWRERKKGQR